MKHKLFIAFATLLAWSMSAMAQEYPTSDDFGDGSGLHWALTGTSPNYTLTITKPNEGTGEMSFSGSSTQGWGSHKDDITKVVIEGGVTSIGANSFQSHGALATVEIKATTVTTIGTLAFYGCSALTSIDIPCSVTEIESSAFYGCTNLANVTVNRYYSPTDAYPITAVSDISVFEGCGEGGSGLTLHAPCSLYEGDANWSAYFGTNISIIESMTPCTAWALTPPEAIDNLSYTGSAQALVTAGTASKDGTMEYSTDNTNWSTSPPTAVEIDKHHVYYRVTMKTPAFTSDAYGPIDVNIHLKANEDPQGPGEYYSTFFYSSANYTIPANTEAYIAKNQNNTSLKLTKLAGSGDIIPADNAFIIKANTYMIKMNSTTDAATVEVEENSNDLLGHDAVVESANVPANAYVLSGGTSEGNYQEGAGFYKLATGTPIPAHKAYVVLPDVGGGAPPRRLSFVYNSLLGATGMEEVVSDQQSAVSVQKVLIDGQFFIKDGERLYNAQGQVIENDHLFIYRNRHKYDATGRVVE